jgi:hypothetical protein
MAYAGWSEAKSRNSTRPCPPRRAFQQCTWSGLSVSCEHFDVIGIWLGDFRVWSNADSDGVSKPGELKTYPTWASPASTSIRHRAQLHSRTAAPSKVLPPSPEPMDRAGALAT